MSVAITSIFMNKNIDSNLIKIAFFNISIGIESKALGKELSLWRMKKNNWILANKHKRE